MITHILNKYTPLMAICLISLLLGAPFGFIFSEQTEDTLLPAIEKIKEQILVESRFQTALNIFFNNLRVCTILIISGTFIIVPFFMLFANGFFLGFVIKLLTEKNLGAVFFIKGVVLHSIFELPAIFISASAGIRIGTSYFTGDRKKRVKRVSQMINEAAVIYFLVVIPLLLIAAFVEAFVSAELIM